MKYNTIKLKNYMPTPVMEEYTATAVAITPGHLLELTSAGLVQKHHTAGGAVLPAMFAVEDELQGGGIDNDFSVSAKLQCWIPTRGDQVYAFLKDGENAIIGEALVSAGDGTLKCLATDSAAVLTESIIAVALENVDLTASANTAAGRIIVRII
jgi:hypothetical protein